MHSLFQRLFESRENKPFVFFSTWEKKKIYSLLFFNSDITPIIIPGILRML